MSKHPSVLIFSKDRPAQLDLFLRSAGQFGHDHILRGIVLWRATTRQAGTGYAEVFAEHKIAHIRQGGFRDDVVGWIARAGELVQFFVDDNVIIAPPVNMWEWEKDSLCMSLSLRMSPTMRYCYTEHATTPPPLFRDDYSWWWPGRVGDWGTPNSVDGNVYRKRDLLNLPDFAAPNSFEPAIRTVCNRPLCGCAGPVVTNVVWNTVQDDAPANRHGAYLASEMTDNFLRGQRIAISPILSAEKNAPHIQCALEWA